MKKISSKQFFHPAIYYLTLTITAVIIFSWYITQMDWNNSSYLLVDMINGTANRPFVYRILIPTLVGSLDRIFPLLPEIYTVALMLFSLLGFAIAMRSLAISFWKAPMVADFISILSLVGLFPFLIRDGKIYDLPGLFLFTLGLFLIAQKKWRSFFIVYFLYCLDKETAIYLSVIFAFSSLKLIRTWSYWRNLLLQGIIYGTIRLAIIWAFRNNPGVVIGFQLVYQIYGLLYFPYFLMLYGSFAACAAILVLIDWHKKPRFLRLAAVCLVPTVVACYFFFGSPYEIRGLLELYPVCFLLSVPTLARAFRIKFPEVVQ